MGLVLGWKPKIRDQPGQLAFTPIYRGLVGVAKPGGGLGNGIKHRLQIESRAADDLQYVASRSLVFEQLLKISGACLQSAKRLCAGNRDHRLLGEGL